MLVVCHYTSTGSYRSIFIVSPPSHDIISRIGIFVGTSLEDGYLQIVPRENRNVHRIRTRQNIFDILFDNRIDASLIDASAVKYKTNNVYCDLTLCGTDFGKITFRIALLKEFRFNHIISQMDFSR